MTTDIQTEPLKRSLCIDEVRFVKSGDNDAEFEFSASSSAPVTRNFNGEVMQEILHHDTSAIRMDRLNAGAVPLLWNHQDDGWPAGKIISARVENNKLRVRAKFYSTDVGQRVRTMVEEGLRNVSVGYKLHKVRRRKDDPSIMDVVDWEPYEMSVVNTPADISVGFGRSEPDRVVEVRILSDQLETAEDAINARKASMTEVVDASAGGSADIKVSALEIEKQRREAIQNLCKANRIDSRVEARWIQDGVSLETIAKEVLDVMEARSKSQPAGASALGMSKKETSNYSLFRAIRAMRFGPQNARYIEEAGFEMECSRALAQKLGRQTTSSMLVPAEVLSRPLPQEAMQRAMATTPGAKGGYLVNVENMGFIEILRNRSVAMNMGARVLSGLQGNVVFPRQTGKVSVTWQAGEHTSVTAADQALGQLSMTPKTCIAITDVSEQLLAQASISAEAFVMADLARDVAIDGVDNAVINGTGGAQPLGIKNTTGVTTGQDAATATYAKMLAFVSTAAGANAIRGNPGFVTNAAGAAILMNKQRFTSTDTPLWDGNIMDGSLVGFRAMASEQLASGNLIFGSWDEVVIGEWGVLELATDTGGTRFNAAQVGIRAMWMVDVMLRYPQAFVVSTNLSA